MKWCWVLILVCATVYGETAKKADVKEFYVDDDWNTKYWWHHAVIYQIYTRSFKDTDKDGIGDLKGIIEKIDYLKELGVTAVWLNPIYPSGNVDFGYDITDFKAIDPIYGDMEDFKNLVDKLKEKDIKLIMDFVPNHTSNKHPWFLNALANKPPYSDYYVFRNDTTNWAECLMGPGTAWEEVPKGSSIPEKYYYHKFFKEQPDLNFENPQVVQEMTSVLQFWISRGVYGFRMDAVSALREDPQFPDNPPGTGLYTDDYPSTFLTLKDFRTFLDTNKLDNYTRIMFTESYTQDPTKLQSYYEYQSGNVAHFPFNMQLATMSASSVTLTPDNTLAQELADRINYWYNNITLPVNGWSNWLLGNHDQKRIASRFSRELVDAFNIMNLMLKGTAITYYGEEIGMEDTTLFGKENLDPQYYRVAPDWGRDPQRSPMPWTRNKGFTDENVKSWLPMNPNYRWTNVEDQKSKANSHLKVYQKVAKLRPLYLMRKGECTVTTLTNHTGVLAIYRWAPDNPTVLALLNFGLTEEKINMQNERDSLPSQLYPYVSNEIAYEHFKSEYVKNTEIVLPPSGAVVLVSQDLNIPIKIDRKTSKKPSEL